MAFKRLGVMLDMSRNAVMHVPALKDFIKELADMGYNTLLLYTEDTYEVPGEPYFGHFRGRYSQQELREIVDFAGQYHMEVIPCIQTLAHLNAIFRWKIYQPLRDCNDILLAGDDEVYAFIGRMLDSVKACYRSEYVHIGMDEAHMVGLGKYLDRFGYEDRFQILSRHLHRVCQMAADRGLKPIMWGDMYFRLKNHGEYNITDAVLPSPEEAVIPDNVDITYWDYYNTEEPVYNSRIRAHKALGRPVWFAGGYWVWNGFAPCNRFSLRSTLAAVRTCREEGVENVFFTMWGDDGGECSRYAALPSLFAGARFCQGQEDMDTIRADFEARYGIPFDAFLALDMHPDNGSAKATNAIKTPEKYLLYNDPFLGVCDSTLNGSEDAHYEQVAAALSQYAGQPTYGLVFNCLSRLAAILSRKACLGLRTRQLYQANDKAGTKQLLADYAQCICQLDGFIDSFRTMWMAENKPFGFEVQEIRLGGLLQRLRSCHDRLSRWCEDGTPIPELAEENLDLMGGGREFAKQHLHYPRWQFSGFTGVLHM